VKRTATLLTCCMQDENGWKKMKTTMDDENGCGGRACYSMALRLSALEMKVEGSARGTKKKKKRNEKAAK